jgi:hypothetical protein
MKMIKDDLFKLLVNLLLLSKNDITLSLNGWRLEFRILKNVGNDINGNRNILSEALCIVHCLLARSVCIQMCAKILNLELQCMLVATTGALEGHMLEEMGGSIGFVSLSTRTSINPDANCCGLSMRMRLCGNR